MTAESVTRERHRSVRNRLRVAPNRIRIALAAACSLVLVHCGPKPNLHPDFEKMKPTVIAVLPPENTTANTQVEEIAYPILFTELANRGYYCLSPEMIRATFDANRLEDAGRINRLPPQKFKDVFNADAILRTKVTEWSSKYVVISSSVTVSLDMELVDTKTGQRLWSMRHTVSKSPSDGGCLLGAMLNAAVHAIFTSYEPIMEENAQITLETVPKGDYGKDKSPK